MENQYKYAIWDLSYILNRNIFPVSKGKEPGTYTEGDLIKTIIWTLAKCPKDYGISADKVILLGDKWLGDQGYYVTQILDGAYKDSRGEIKDLQGQARPKDTYMTREKLEEMKADPTATPEEIHEAEIQVYRSEVKTKAKWTIIRELKNYGYPTCILDGYEADNFGYMASILLYDENSSKKNVLITKDSDWQYFTTPKMDYFKLPSKGKDPETITYEKMCNDMPSALHEKVSLYYYKAFIDSFGAEGSHNGMRRTLKSGVDVTNAILNILDGDFSDLSDPDLFKKQFSTFHVEKYPEFERAKRLLLYTATTGGRLGTVDEFHDFCDRIGITSGISDTYFNTFISRFDPSLYKER